MEDGFSKFVEFDLQIIALSWLAVLYLIKAYQLSRLPMPREKGPRTGNPSEGILATYAHMFMPWSMESTRNHFWRWFEFGIYHIGAFIGILNTFTTPFAPGMMTTPVRIAFALLIIPAFFAGFFKLARRFTDPNLRYVSNPDDYFSLIALQLWFLSAIMALLLDVKFWNDTYFVITALFLFYVPFSKISHYVYYFFSGVIVGGKYGWRGVAGAEGRSR